MALTRIQTDALKDAITSSNIADGTIVPADLSTGRPTWDSSSNLGINTATPSTYGKLVTRTSTNQTAFSAYCNDTTTGLIADFRGYDNSLGEVSRVVIQAGGSVGVNTTTPKTKLHVASSNASDTPTLGTATGGLFITNSNPNYGLHIGSQSTGNVWLQATRNDFNATAYNLHLQPAGGNVVIGGSAANQKLEVTDSTQSGIVYTRISNTYGSSTNNGAGTGLQFYGWDAGVTANIKSLREAQAYSPSYLSFETFGGSGNTANNSLVERMRIDGYGRIIFSQPYYAKKTMLTASSNFTNPVVTIVSVTSAGSVNQQFNVKVRVLQSPYASSVSNEHQGLASVYQSAANTLTTSVTTMGISINNGTSNVGTLSWSTSGNTGTLSYTCSRAGNYDSYFIEVEVFNPNAWSYTLG